MNESILDISDQIEDSLSVTTKSKEGCAVREITVEELFGMPIEKVAEIFFITHSKLDGGILDFQPFSEVGQRVQMNWMGVVQDAVDLANIAAARRLSDFIRNAMDVSDKIAHMAIHGTTIEFDARAAFNMDDPSVVETMIDEAFGDRRDSVSGQNEEE